MKKTLSTIAAITVVATTIPLFSATVSAEGLGTVNQKLNELQQEKSELNEQKSDISSEANSTEDKIAENQEEQNQISSDIDQISSDLEDTQARLTAKQNEIATTNNEIEDTEQKITETEEEIEDLKTEIEDLKERIETREELLKNRLRAIQQNGGSISYLQVIMGSQNFGDFLNRATAVTKIMDQDKDIMESQKSDKLALEENQQDLEDKQASLVAAKENLESKKASLVTQQQELNALKASLNSQMSEKESLMVGLEEEQHELEEYKMSLEEEQRVLANQQAIINKAIQEAQAEKERLEQLAKENNSSGNSSGSSAPTASSGGSSSFIWPASGRFSSGYGGRSLGYHYGVDIAAGAGTPIKAAASGVVTRSDYSSSYGNVVYIYHPQMNKTTVYAHMVSRPAVSLGQSVTQGQYIGGIGNTGNSFGNHLHFEIHNGGWSYKGGINPMPYLP